MKGKSTLFLFVASGLIACNGLSGLNDLQFSVAEGSDSSSTTTLSTCNECLFATQPACEDARQVCLNDSFACAPINECSQYCEDAPDALSCVQTCCSSAGGNAVFDAYLTCLCDACEEECGALVLGCQDSCNQM